MDFFTNNYGGCYRKPHTVVISPTTVRQNARQRDKTLHMYSATEFTVATSPVLSHCAAICRTVVRFVALSWARYRDSDSARCPISATINYTRYMYTCTNVVKIFAVSNWQETFFKTTIYISC